MNKPELTKAFDLAKSDEDLSTEDIDLFCGFGLSEFDPIYCTIRQVARIIRYQCQYMNGGWDMDNFQEIANFGRKLFMIIG